MVNSFATTRVRAALLGLVMSAAFSGQAAEEVERLPVLCRVWAAADFLHPDVVFGDVDWDAALLRAIPKVRAARSDDELAAALGSMLAELRDPVTCVFTVTNPVARTDVPLFRREGDVLVLNAGPYGAAHEGMWVEMRAVSGEINKANGLVVDLRFRGEPDRAEMVAFAVSLLDIARTDATTPAEEYVMHSGFAPEGGATSGGYYTALVTIPGRVIRAASRPAPARIAFVTDARSPLPELAVALQQGGQATIVSSDPLDSGALADSVTVKVGGPWRAAIRVSRPLGPLAADQVSPDPMAEALAIVRGEKPPPPRPVTGSSGHESVPRRRRAPAFADMVAPDVEHRILAAFRLWSVIEYFYPYKSLIGDWDAVLPEMLPRFIAAGSGDEYAAAVLEMVARIEDSHSRAWGHPSVPRLIGTASPRIEVRSIEGEFVVTRILGDVAGAAIRPGDLLVRVDGESFRARLERLRKYVAASTERGRINAVAAAAIRGEPGSQALLEVKGPDGAVRPVRMERLAPPQKPSDAPAFRVLEGNIGYADLTTLMPAQVDAMFDALMNTRAIIFDMRGYPRGTGWQIAPRLNTRGASVGAVFRRPQVFGAESSEAAAAGFYFEQPLPTSDQPLYRGRTVMLIDDRTISQAEHTGLFFEAANGTTFIGSHTAGANGDVTTFSLPGGFRVAFTGHDVRHADGRQLQRVGIVPHVVVEPTIHGIREGRDEVLERALAHLKELEQ